MAATIPSQEQILQLLDQSQALPDTRNLYPGQPAEARDGTWSEEAFKENAKWQLQLQSSLNSLLSREVRYLSDSFCSRSLRLN